MVHQPWILSHLYLGSCNCASYLGHPYLVPSNIVVIRSMIYCCSMCPGCCIFMLHCYSWPHRKQRNIFARIQICTCMALPVYKGSVVIAITIKLYGWSTEPWQYASYRSLEQQCSQFHNPGQIRLILPITKSCKYQ